LSVLLLDSACLRAALGELLAPYGLTIAWTAAGRALPGSYWGEPEAGLVGDVLHAAVDTPLHSALHEAAHYVCMSADRRATLLRDAGGDHAEENAVCYLQILWGDALAQVGAARVMQDMDAWGYTFRLGSTARWFAEDAADACAWLQSRGIIDAAGRPTGRLQSSGGAQPA
jgi:hypothetical protein